MNEEDVMRKKLLWVPLSAGAIAAAVKAKDCVDKYIAAKYKRADVHVSTFELDKRYPECKCLAAQLKEYTAHIYNADSNAVEVTRVKCTGDLLVTVSMRDGKYAYDLNYDAYASELHSVRYPSR